MTKTINFLGVGQAARLREMGLMPDDKLLGAYRKLVSETFGLERFSEDARPRLLQVRHQTDHFGKWSLVHGLWECPKTNDTTWVFWNHVENIFEDMSSVRNFFEDQLAFTQKQYTPSEDYNRRALQAEEAYQAEKHRLDLIEKRTRLLADGLMGYGFSWMQAYELAHADSIRHLDGRGIDASLQEIVTGEISQFLASRRQET